MRQRVCRWAVVVALALAVVYVTLPYWAPRAAIARGICRQLSSQLGVPVHLGSVTISWGRGVVIHDLVIDSSGEPNAPPLVSVHRLRADLSPLVLAAQNRLDWMELDDPHLCIRFDADGNCNLDPLRRFQADITTRRISIRHATVDLCTPVHEQPIRLDVADVQLLAGQRAPIGKMTMSGSLRQQGASSPISVYFSEGDGASDVAGVASLKFRDADLEQLHLERVLGRLRTFSGRCSGSLDLQANRQGKIDRFALNVSVQRLDVQPRVGSPLPVIEQATIQATAAYDFVTTELDIRSMQVRLPGLAMAGQASVLLAAPGGWESIRALHLAGRVVPHELTALTGSGLPGVELQGPVDLDVSIDEKPAAVRGATLHVALGAKATEARIVVGSRVVKPTGRTLEAQVAGELSLDDWSFATFGEQSITLGRNVLRGSGRVRNLKGILGRFDPNEPLNLLGALAGVKCEGTWDVNDAAALADLVPGGPELLAQVRLDGPLGGRFAVDQAEGTAVRVGLTVPAATSLAVGDVFHKAKGKDLKLTMSAMVDAPPSLRDVDLHLSLGEGRLHAYNGNWSLGSAGGALGGSGGFEVEQVQSLMELLAAAPAGLELRGNLDGKYSLNASDTSRAISVEADIEPLAVSLGQALGKAAGQAGQARVTATRQMGPSPQEQVQVSYRWAGGDLGAIVTGTGEANVAAVSASLDVRDANTLGSLSPMVARVLHNCRLSGPISARAAGSWAGDSFEGKLAVDANGADLTVASGGVDRRKPAGQAASLTVDGRVTVGADLAIDALLRSAVVEGPSCGLAVEGELGLASPISPGQEFFDRPLRQFQCTVKTHARFDAALRQWLPEVDEAIAGLKFDSEFWCAAGAPSRLDIGGPLTTTTTVALHDDLYSIRFQLDANGLTLAGPLVKPAHMPAGIEAELTLRPGPWRVQLNTLAARIGADAEAIRIVADGNARIDLAAGSLADATGQAAVSINDAALLGQLVVPLADYAPAGAAFLRARWHEANGPVISQAEVQTPGVSARWHGRRVSISGQACVEDLAGTGGDCPAVGAIRSDGLSVEAGTMTLHLLADVREPLTAPSGKVDVLAGTLDLKDIAEWIAPPQTPQSVPQSRPEMTPAEANDVMDQARSAVAMLRQGLQDANIRFTLAADNFRVHDDPTDQYFDLRYAQVAVGLDHGKVKLSLSGGANGGEVTKALEFDLAGASPAAEATTTLRDVLARPNVQPQITRIFPGNTVYGSISQNQKVTMPVADLVAGMIDPRHAVHAVGEGQTVAADGMIEGRAAPEFIASVFPGLNLTQYRYSKMTSFADYKDDGSSLNDMIFTGPIYDLYIQGTTDPQHVAHYETGMILLSPPQSPQWNHSYRVGRIPLLKIKARIEDGKLLDQEVSYPWPNQTLGAIFIRDNFFYRLWVNAQQKK